MKKKNNELYNEEKSQAYDFVIFSLAHEFAYDGDTDFVTHAQKVCKHYVNYMRVYNYLYRNRHEIMRASRNMGSQRLHEIECNDC